MTAIAPYYMMPNRVAEPSSGTASSAASANAAPKRVPKRRAPPGTHILNDDAQDTLAPMGTRRPRVTM